MARLLASEALFDDQVDVEGAASLELNILALVWRYPSVFQVEYRGIRADLLSRPARRGEKLGEVWSALG